MRTPQGLPANRKALVVHRNILRLVLNTDFMTLEKRGISAVRAISFDAATLGCGAHCSMAAALPIAPSGQLDGEALGAFMRAEASTRRG